MSDMAKYCQRVKAGARGGYRGRGPSKDMLTLRQTEREMENTRKIFFAEENLKDLFKKLGFNRRVTFQKYQEDPNSPHSYKDTQYKKKIPISQRKRPGRPPGSGNKNKRHINRHDSLISSSSDESQVCLLIFI